MEGLISMAHVHERYIPGPAFIRCCDSLSGGGYRWSEEFGCEVGMSFDGLNPPCGFLLPNDASGSIVKWPTVGSARLLVDLMASKEAADYRCIFSLLGKNLAEFHFLDAPMSLFENRLINKVEETEVYRKALRYASEQGVFVPAFSFRSGVRLIHGRFSTAMVLADEKRKVMISADVGRGDPMFDISQILSEIWEFYCSFSKSENWRRQMGLAARAFVDSYEKQSRCRIDMSGLWEMCRAKSAVHVLILAFLRKDISIFRSHIASLELGESFFDYLA